MTTQIYPDYFYIFSLSSENTNPFFLNILSILERREVEIKAGFFIMVIHENPYEVITKMSENSISNLNSKLKVVNLEILSSDTYVFLGEKKDLMDFQKSICNFVFESLIESFQKLIKNKFKPNVKTRLVKMLILLGKISSVEQVEWLKKFEVLQVLMEILKEDTGLENTKKEYLEKYFITLDQLREAIQEMAEEVGYGKKLTF